MSRLVSKVCVSSTANTRLATAKMAAGHQPSPRRPSPVATYFHIPSVLELKTKFNNISQLHFYDTHGKGAA